MVPGERTLSGFFGFFAGHSLSAAAHGPLTHDGWNGSWILGFLWTRLQRRHFGVPRGMVPIWILGILCGIPFPGVESPWVPKNPKQPKNPTPDLLPRSPALQRDPKNPTNLVFHVRFW